MVLDHRYHQLDRFRLYVSCIVYPIQTIVDAPFRLTSLLQQNVTSYRHLTQENKELRDNQVLLNARMQKFKTLEVENARLRVLLDTTPRDNEKLAVAEIIRVNSDPFVHRVVLNKGSLNGVVVGQPVIDAEGVIGEVTEVHPLASRAILLTDASYGIPVENIRNGVRGIARGTGAVQYLELKHISQTVDLEVGDTLVTSGLDGRYPPGYPVGIISQIEHDPGESFSRVRVTPSGHLDRSRQVLLVQWKKTEELP